VDVMYAAEDQVSAPPSVVNFQNGRVNNGRHEHLPGSTRKPTIFNTNTNTNTPTTAETKHQ